MVKIEKMTGGDGRRGKSGYRNMLPAAGIPLLEAIMMIRY